MKKNILKRCLAGVAAVAFGASACSVPVFRYALERWENAPYRAVVLRRGPLSENEKNAVADLKRAALDARAPANLEVEEIDVDSDLKQKKNEAISRWWRAHDKFALPYVVLLYPDAEDEIGYAWGGALEAGIGEKICRSPARKEIARRLLSGGSAVWVVLGVDDQNKTAQTTLNLETELDKLQKEIPLPTDDDSQGGPPIKLMSKIPLKISFSVVQVKRDDPAESVFVSMLGEIEKKTKDRTQPAALVIFGRGRLLAGLSGTEIKAETIRDASYFFAQPCSCRVKELNPGNDLLFAVDWESELASAEGNGAADPKAPSVPPKQKAVETVKIAMPEYSVPVVTVDIDMKWAAAIAAGLVTVLCGVWVVMSAKKKRL